MEYFFICGIVLIANNQELLVVFNQLCNVLSKQRERRIGHNDVCLFKQFDTLLATEIAVAFQWLYANLLCIWCAVAVLVAFIYKIHSLLALVLAEQIHILILVASGYEFLQAEKLEVVGEVSEEVAYAWVVAVAQHRLSTEMVVIVTQFVVYVFELCIELVFFGSLSLVDSSFYHE